MSLGNHLSRGRALALQQTNSTVSMTSESCSGRSTCCSLKTYASFCGCSKCLAACCSDQCFFAESLSIGGWYTSLKLAAADKTCMISEPDSSQSKQMANSERTWRYQRYTPNLGKRFSSNPDVSKRIFRVLCNHFSQQVLKEQHTLNNWMDCCVIPFVVAPSLCAHFCKGSSNSGDFV